MYNKKNDDKDPYYNFDQTRPQGGGKLSKFKQQTSTDSLLNNQRAGRRDLSSQLSDNIKVKNLIQ